jgi:uncharacterized protein YbaA (DUF1428 family)
MAYVDFFVVPVPKRKLAAYKAMARKWARSWKKMGVESYMEMVADDVKPGKLTSFPQSVKLKTGEVVVVGCMTFKNRKSRDMLWKKMMADPAMANMDMKKKPFDGKRMFWGGFKPIVNV